MAICPTVGQRVRDTICLAARQLALKDICPAACEETRKLFDWLLQSNIILIFYCNLTGYLSNLVGRGGVYYDLCYYLLAIASH